MFSPFLFSSVNMGFRLYLEQNRAERGAFTEGIPSPSYSSHCLVMLHLAEQVQDP